MFSWELKKRWATQYMIVIAHHVKVRFLGKRFFLCPCLPVASAPLPLLGRGVESVPSRDSWS